MLRELQREKVLATMVVLRDWQNFYLLTGRGFAH
jgi:hypothetical protein